MMSRWFGFGMKGHVGVAVSPLRLNNDGSGPTMRSSFRDRGRHHDIHYCVHYVHYFQ